MPQLPELLAPESTCPVVAAAVDLAGNPQGLTPEQIESLLAQMRQITDALAAEERAYWLAELDAEMARA